MMIGKVGLLCALSALIPPLATAQQPGSGAKLPPARPPLIVPMPDSTKSEDESTPTEKVELSFPPAEMDYKEQRRGDEDSGRSPGRSPISDPKARLDDLRVVSVVPGSGEIEEASSGEPLIRENSIEVTLAYDLASSPQAVVSAELRAPGSGRITSIEASPNRVYDEHGSVRKRLSISCGPDVSDRIRRIRLHYWMYVPPDNTLVDKEQSLSHTIRCADAARIPGPKAAAALPGDEPSSLAEMVRPPRPSIDPDVKRPPPARIGACPDLATFDLSPRLVGRTDPTRGVGIIEVVGIVRNVGRAAYVSDPRQQSVELIEEQPGTPPRIVESRSFTNLAPNGTVRLDHRRGWDTSTEFQPRYRLRLVYEPDIRTDANPRNDDCGPGNNEVVLEPARIDALFR